MGAWSLPMPDTDRVPDCRRRGGMCASASFTSILFLLYHAPHCCDVYCSSSCYYPWTALRLVHLFVANLCCRSSSVVILIHLGFRVVKTTPSPALQDRRTYRLSMPLIEMSYFNSSYDPSTTERRTHFLNPGPPIQTAFLQSQSSSKTRVLDPRPSLLAIWACKAIFCSQT